MLSFVTFDGDGIEPREFPPRHAYLHGPDELPLQADVTMSQGHVLCQYDATHSKALVVQVSLEGPEPLGLLTLPTCLLPDRANSYLLPLELARHQIMLFLNKLEDWQLTDLPPESATMRRFEEARDAFTAALVAQRSPTGQGRAGFSAEASRAAVRTLAQAVDAGEQLTLIQAERQLAERSSGKLYEDAVGHFRRVTQEGVPAGAPVVVPGGSGVVLPGPAQVGCAVSPATAGEPAQRALMGACDFVSMPMRWNDMEPREGKYSFAGTDRWIEWAVRAARVPVHAGPLVDFRASCIPDWLYIWENDYETLRDLVIEHIQAIVTRYRRTVHRWTVASGLNVNTNFKLPLESALDLTRVAVLVVRKLQPQAKVQVEIAQPWGEYHAYNKRSIPPLVYAEAMVQMGLPIDAIALRLQMGHAQPGLSTRDLLSLSALIDRYAQFEKPLAVTALGCPSAPIAPTPYQPRAGSAAEDPYEPGRWRDAWSEAQQASWLECVVATCCSKPSVQSVCWQDLADPAPGVAPPEMPFGGLLTSALAPKLALGRLAQIRQGVRTGKAALSVVEAPPRAAR